MNTFLKTCLNFHHTRIAVFNKYLNTTGVFWLDFIWISILKIITVISIIISSSIIVIIISLGDHLF